jgi:hypothetical protein
MRLRAAAVLLTCVLAPAVSAQPPRLKPGQYELSSEISLPGRSNPLPGRKDTHCYTAKDVDNLAAVIAGNGTKSDTCKVTSSKTTGAVVGFTTACTHPDGTVVNSSVEIEFTSAESFHAVVHMSDASGRSANPVFMNSTINVTARRIGDCDK